MLIALVLFKQNMETLKVFVCFTILLFFYDVQAVAEHRPVIKTRSLKFDNQIKSCLDVLQNGATESGLYRITIGDDGPQLPVYCDLTSEPGAAWTLVMSYSKDKSTLKEFQMSPLSHDAPLNRFSQNWNSYRLSRNDMLEISGVSTRWRFTCSFPVNGVDYRDYARARVSVMNPLTYNGDGVCVRMEYLDIRGHSCAGCTAAWWQNSTQAEPLHIDSSVDSCHQFDARKGSIKSEDNFGYYVTMNPRFRCVADDASTTNFWFGAYL